jgi:hypothetical protein
MTLKLTNNASALLAVGVDADDTAVALTPGTGAKFPALAAGEWFPLVVIAADGGLEIMRATARTADVITVTRAQEGTVGRIFSSGARVELRLTRAAMEAMPTLTAQLLARDGTAAAPARSYANDPDSGEYRIGPNNIGVAVGGTKVLDISTAGLDVTGVLDADDVQVDDDLNVAGDTTVAGLTASGIVDSGSTSHIGLAAGTSAQRPVSPATADFRYNSNIKAPEFYDGASWIALAASILKPQGYLTLVSGTPVVTGDVTSNTVFYTPDEGNLAPLFDGAVWRIVSFTERPLTLNVNHLANTIYDVFFFEDPASPGSYQIGTGPAWSSSTAGSGSRGGGGGSSELTRVGGRRVNAVQITARNGGTTYTVAANRALYLGSVHIDGAAGQVTCHRSYGQNRKWGVWNAYNRRSILIRAGDATASWNYTSSTIRQSNNASGNKITVFAGLAEETIDLLFTQHIVGEHGSGAAAALEFRIGIGINSTTAYTGHTGYGGHNLGGGGNTVDGATRHNLIGKAIVPPTIGVQEANALESSPVASIGDSATRFGGEANMLLTASWMG